jgi:hypothetical protein
LPSLWADSGPDGRQALALALFARTEVMGFEQMSYEPTPDAIELGLNAALPPVYELRASIGEFGRGERSRADTIRVRCRADKRRRDGAKSSPSDR